MLEIHKESINVVILVHLELSELVLHICDSVKQPETSSQDLHKMVVVDVSLQRIIFIQVK